MTNTSWVSKVLVVEVFPYKRYQEKRYLKFSELIMSIIFVTELIHPFYILAVAKGEYFLKEYLIYNFR